MQKHLSLQMFPVRRTKQLAVNIDHRMQRTVDLLLPELYEVVQHGEIWRDIIILPDKELQQMRMIRHVVEKLCRCQTVTGKLELKSRLRTEGGL